MVPLLAEKLRQTRIGGSAERKVRVSVNPNPNPLKIEPENGHCPVQFGMTQVV